MRIYIGGPQAESNKKDRGVNPKGRIDATLQAVSVAWVKYNSIVSYKLDR